MDIVEKRIRRDGALGIVGGVVWLAWALSVTAGHVGAVGPPGESVVAFAAAASALPITLGIRGTWARVRLSRHYGWFGRLGAALGLVGGVAFAVGRVAAGTYGGESLLALLFGVPGALGLILGSVLLAVSSLRTKTAPLWLAALLFLGALLFLVFDAGSWRSVFAVPYGLAWVALGYDLRKVPDGGGDFQPRPAYWL